MDMNIDEQWLEIPRARKWKDGIVAISNTGKYRKLDGTIDILRLRRGLKYDGRKEYAYRLIAEHFLITVRRPDQNFIDHITHNPTEYNVNDVRNLRWCTIKENMNFEEAKENMTGDKHPQWKNDNVRPKALYRRALVEYRRNPTQENLAILKEARLKRNEYRRHLRRDKKSLQ